MVGSTALIIESEMFEIVARRGNDQTGRSAPHISQAGADIDRCRSQWHQG
jgi:hypothetical protein